jgi:hypothetical protein
MYENKNDYKKKNRFRDKKKKNIKKIMSQACAALSDYDFLSEDFMSQACVALSDYDFLSEDSSRS